MVTLNEIYHNNFPSASKMILEEKNATLKNNTLSVLNSLAQTFLPGGFEITYLPKGKNYTEWTKQSYADLTKEIDLYTSNNNLKFRSTLCLAIACAVAVVAKGVIGVVVLGVAVMGVLSHYPQEQSLIEMKIRAALKSCEANARISHELDQIRADLKAIHPQFELVEEAFYSDIYEKLIQYPKNTANQEFIQSVATLLKNEDKLIDPASNQVYLGALHIISNHLKDLLTYGNQESCLQVAKSYIKAVKAHHLREVPPYVDVVQSVLAFNHILASISLKFNTVSIAFYHEIYKLQLHSFDRTANEEVGHRQFIQDVTWMLYNQNKLIDPSTGDVYIASQNVLLTLFAHYLTVVNFDQAVGFAQRYIDFVQTSELQTNQIPVIKSIRSGPLDDEIDGGKSFYIDYFDDDSDKEDDKSQVILLSSSNNSTDAAGGSGNR
jgi:hypothetical protein